MSHYGSSSFFCTTSPSTRRHRHSRCEGMTHAIIELIVNKVGSTLPPGVTTYIYLKNKLIDLLESNICRAVLPPTDVRHLSHEVTGETFGCNHISVEAFPAFTLN